MPRNAEGGQGLTEYSMIIVLVAVVLIGAVYYLGQFLSSSLDTASAATAPGAPIASRPPGSGGRPGVFWLGPTPTVTPEGLLEPTPEATPSSD